jgi:AraC-like DNA-binding protein
MPPEPLHPLPYAEFAPPAHLRDYVACFWRSQTLGQPRQTTVLPDGCIDLIWQANREPFVAGPMTAPTAATTAPGTVTLGVRFRPGVAPSLLGVPAAELRDLSVPLRELWPPTRPLAARDHALAVTGRLSLSDATRAVETLLCQATAVDPLIADACHWFAQHPGQPTAPFIAASGVSERHVRRRFQDHVGYGPKTLQRVLRMQRVLWLMSRPTPPRSLAHLAQAAGYADQAHLTREIRALTGQSPTALGTNNPQSAVADLFKTVTG